MSDTTITPEERAELRAHFERKYTDPCREAEYVRITSLRLLNTLEIAEKALQDLKSEKERAEARADFASSVLQAASDCIVSGDPASDVGLFLECDEFDKKLLVDIAALSVRAEKAEAENARLRAERDWLAENAADRPCAYDSCPFGLHRPTGPDDDDCDKTHAECRIEAARRAVGCGR